MPVDLQRPKKLPTGRESDLQRFEGEKADDGSWIVSIFHKPTGDEEPGPFGGSMKRYTVQNTAQLQTFIGQKIAGSPGTVGTELPEAETPEPPMPETPTPETPDIPGPPQITARRKPEPPLPPIDEEE